MKKITRARRAIKGLAMALALATTISGCSFQNTKDLNNENEIVYDVTDDSVIEEETQEEVVQEQETETPAVNVPVENPDIVDVPEDSKAADTNSNDTSSNKNAEVVNNDKNESIVDLTSEYYIVMFEGEELVIPNLSSQFTEGVYTKNSISKALYLAGFDNSRSFRSKLARFYGIENYRGTANQNITLLNYLRHPELYLDMSLVINNEENIDNTTQNNNDNSNANNNSNTNNNDNNNNNNDNNNNNNDNDDNRGDHDDDEDKHEHQYGSLIVEYSNITETQHTVTLYRICSGCGNKQIISIKTVDHSFTWTQEGKKEIGKCACGYTTERDITEEHEHGNWQKIDTIYVPLENGQHRIDTKYQCGNPLDGGTCPETDIKEGNAVACTFGDDDTCIYCGNVKNHEHGKWEYFDKVVEVNETQHRVDKWKRCKVLKNGVPCNVEVLVSQGRVEDCDFDLNASNPHCSVCNNTHTHDWTWVYDDENQCHQECSGLPNHSREPQNHVSDGTQSDTIIPGSGTKDNHKVNRNGHCSNCDHDYVIGTQIEVPHGDETYTQQGDPSYQQTDNNTHTVTITYKYDGCGYLFYDVQENVVCQDNGTGSCDCGRDLTHTHNWVWVYINDQQCQQVCSVDNNHKGETQNHVSDGNTTDHVIAGSGTREGHSVESTGHCSNCNHDYVMDASITIPHNRGNVELVHKDDTWDQLQCKDCGFIIAEFLNTDSVTYDGQTYGPSKEQGEIVISLSLDEQTEISTPAETAEGDSLVLDQNGVAVVMEEMKDSETTGEETGETEEELTVVIDSEETTGKVVEEEEVSEEKETEIVEQDETELYKAYSEAVDAYLSQYSQKPEEQNKKLTLDQQ